MILYLVFFFILSVHTTAVYNILGSTLALHVQMHLLMFISNMLFNFTYIQIARKEIRLLGDK